MTPREQRWGELDAEVLRLFVESGRSYGVAARPCRLARGGLESHPDRPLRRRPGPPGHRAALPGPGEALVRVAGAAINPLDLKISAGYMHDFFPVEFPYTLGTDVSGTITTLGDRVERWAVGDQIVARLDPSTDPRVALCGSVDLGGGVFCSYRAPSRMYGHCGRRAHSQATRTQMAGSSTPSRSRILSEIAVSAASSGAVS